MLDAKNVLTELGDLALLGNTLPPRGAYFWFSSAASASPAVNRRFFVSFNQHAFFAHRQEKCQHR